LHLVGSCILLYLDELCLSR